MANQHELSETDNTGEPIYTLRRSSRAKRLQLKVTSWGEVEVVLPRRLSEASVIPFVRRHRQWLERALEQAQAMREGQPALAVPCPQNVMLPAIAENWVIAYVTGQRRHARVLSPQDRGGELRVRDGEVAAVQRILRAWLHEKARYHLLPWLQTVSEACRLPYGGASIRAQKTRWGSCSARGHISLNRNLLFLPPHLVRYVLIHELCHTVHHNHSGRYWAAVARHAPDFSVLENELRQAARYIPRWASRE